MSYPGMLIGVLAVQILLIGVGIHLMSKRLWIQGVMAVMVGAGTTASWGLASRYGEIGFLLAIVVWCLACIAIAALMARLCDYFTGTQTSLFTP
jgi:hypothetical protein